MIAGRQTCETPIPHTISTRNPQIRPLMGPVSPVGPAAESDGTGSRIRRHRSAPSSKCRPNGKTCSQIGYPSDRLVSGFIWVCRGLVENVGCIHATFSDPAARAMTRESLSERVAACRANRGKWQGRQMCCCIANCQNNTMHLMTSVTSRGRQGGL